MAWSWVQIDWTATGTVAAAWVQAIGSIAAIAGATMIASRQNRETMARESRREAVEDGRRSRDDDSALLAASRLVSIMRTRLEVYVQRVEVADHRLNASWIGIPTRTSFSSAQRSLASFPLANLRSADALLLFCRSLEVADLCVSSFEAMWDLYEGHPGLIDGIVRDQISTLRRLADEAKELDEGLRELAEPGWRARVDR